MKEILFEDRGEPALSHEVVKLHGDYSLQGHVSGKRDISLRNEIPKKEKHTYNRPEKGFWTSTINKEAKEYKTKWADMYLPAFRDEGEGMKLYIHLYTIVNSPEILHLGSESDVKDLYDEYLVKERDGRRDLFNFKKIAERYDAVHVFEGALYTEEFSTWDTESTVWFRPKSYLKEQFIWDLNK